MLEAVIILQDLLGTAQYYCTAEHASSVWDKMRGQPRPTPEVMIGWTTLSQTVDLTEAAKVIPISQAPSYRPSVSPEQS